MLWNQKTAAAYAAVLSMCASHAAAQQLGPIYGNTVKGIVSGSDPLAIASGGSNVTIQYLINTAAGHDYKGNNIEDEFTQTGDKNPGSFLTVDLNFSSPGSDYVYTREFTSNIGGEVYVRNSSSNTPNGDPAYDRDSTADISFYNGSPSAQVLGYNYVGSHGYTSFVTYQGGKPNPIPTDYLGQNYYIEVATWWNAPKSLDPRFPTELRQSYLLPDMPSCTTSFNNYCDGGVINVYNQNQDLVETLRVNPTVEAAPEPGAWALMMLGVGAIGWMLGYRKRVVVDHKAKLATIG